MGESEGIRILMELLLLPAENASKRKTRNGLKKKTEKITAKAKKASQRESSMRTVRSF